MTDGSGGLGQQHPGEPSWGSMDIQDVAASSSACAKFVTIDF